MGSSVTHWVEATQAGRPARVYLRGCEDQLETPASRTKNYNFGMVDMMKNLLGGCGEN